MNPNNLKCLFCGAAIPNIDTTFRTKNHWHSRYTIGSKEIYPEQFRDEIQIQTLECPSCQKISIDVLGIGPQFENQLMHFYPISFAKQYPDYIPKAIRSDYEEAHAILNLSPKASATLSRRCLQTMIRDFWKISNKKSLADEIDAIDELVSSNTKPVLHALRRLGNIGAHPEKDVNLIIDIEPSEAHQLLQFIELLIQQWYIERHNSEKLLQNIQDISSSKQNLRKN